VQIEGSGVFRRFARRSRRSEAGGGVGQDFPVPDPERLDPPLLPQRQRDEEPQLDQFRNAEVVVEFRPKCIIRDFGIPDDGARIGERDLLPLGELRRRREFEELVVLIFAEAFPSSLDGSLYASVLALDRLGYIDPAQLLDPVVAHAVPERHVPGLRERPDDGRVMRADCLALGPGRSLAARLIQIAKDLGIGYRCRVYVRDAGHAISSGVLYAKAIEPGIETLN
jgi:hypothetical protein